MIKLWEIVGISMPDPFQQIIQDLQQNHTVVDQKALSYQKVVQQTIDVFNTMPDKYKTTIIIENCGWQSNQFVCVKNIQTNIIPFFSLASFLEFQNLKTKKETQNISDISQYFPLSLQFCFNDWESFNHDFLVLYHPFQNRKDSFKLDNLINWTININNNKYELMLVFIQETNNFYCGTINSPTPSTIHVLIKNQDGLYSIIDLSTPDEEKQLDLNSSSNVAFTLEKNHFPFMWFYKRNSHN